MPVKSARKKSGWKDIQSKAKTRRTMLAIGVLGMVVGLLAISWVIRLTQNLFSPWKLSGSYRRNYIWNGEFSINLVVRSKNISVFSYNPKNESVVIVSIPDETFLDVPYGFGRWQLRAVYELGESQKEVGGEKLLADTLTSFFAIPIDGFLDFGTALNQKAPSEIVNALRSSPFSGLDLVSGLKTNLTMWELFKLKLKLYSVRFDKISEIDLAKMSILDKEVLPDGTPVFTADPVKLDSVLAGLADPVITSERKSIAVLNATDHPQLALKWVRLITNLGGNVIITANAPRQLKETQVAGKDSPTLRRFQQVFQLGCQKSPKCDKVNPLDENMVYQRADINILLGEDFADR